MTAPMTPERQAVLRDLVAQSSQWGGLLYEDMAGIFAEVDRLSAELARVTAERDRMRPVYDAALAFRFGDHDDKDDLADTLDCTVDVATLADCRPACVVIYQRADGSWPPRPPGAGWVHTVPCGLPDWADEKTTPARRAAAPEVNG